MSASKTAHRQAIPQRKNLIWGNLLHLSYNFWNDRDLPDQAGDRRYHSDSYYRPCLRFDKSLWDDVLERMASAGMNMVVIDLGDGVKYGSHPEIAVEGAWSVEELRSELARMRQMGLEAIPKLNFSTCHDAWLGRYSRMVSTDIYYAVCRDLIAETLEIFDKPRFLHLGMDEESLPFARLQHVYAHMALRLNELWWHDLKFLFQEVEKGGARPWIWSDYAWYDRKGFAANVPRSVIQSSWCYDPPYTRKNISFKGFLDLEADGYDQIPTSMNRSAGSMREVAARCRRYLEPRRLYGFLQTTWCPTVESCRQIHMSAIEEVVSAMERIGSRR